VWPQWQESISSLLEDSRDLPTQLSETLQEVKLAVHDVRTNVLPDVERSMNSLQQSMAALETMSNTYKDSAPKWAAQVTGIMKNIDHMAHGPLEGRDSMPRGAISTSLVWVPIFDWCI